jgi:hypothetical protein
LGVGVLLAETLAPNLEGPLAKWDRSSVVPLKEQSGRQPIQAGCDVNVFISEDLLLTFKSPLQTARIVPVLGGERQFLIPPFPKQV